MTEEEARKELEGTDLGMKVENERQPSNQYEEGEIMNVAVRREYRRKGVAGRLMKELLSRAEKRGAARFILEVREGNLPAVRLYESLGFLHAGRRRNFYSDPAEDALIMIKEI